MSTTTPATSPAPGTAARNPLATAALVVGIVAVVLALLTGWVGSLLGVVAVVLAVLARRQVAGSARAGLVLGVVAIVLGVVMTVVGALVLASLGMV